MEAPSSEEFKGASLLLGGGVGWAGAFSLDLLINSLEEVKHIGPVRCPHVLPMIGAGAFDCFPEETVTTAVELYHGVVNGVNTAIMQHRGPVLRNHNGAYAKEMAAWVKENGLKEVVVLWGIDSAWRADGQIRGSQRRVVAPADHEVMTGLGEGVWKELELSELEEETRAQFLRPGSFLTELQKECAGVGVPLVMFLRFCAEGNTIPDCHDLLIMLNEYLHLLESGQARMQAPSSWKYVQGPPLQGDDQIY